MTPYLTSSIDVNSSEFIEVFDDLPLWSAPFGLKILESVVLRDSMTVLDIGSGSGFPLIELAQRVSPGSRLFGIDPWTAGVDRIKRKASILGLDNVQMFKGIAEELPFDDGSLDCIVSNNGLNNVQDDEKALKECHRVARNDAQLLLTANLPETMQAFYAVFKMTLRQAGLEQQIPELKAHILEKRKPLADWRALLFQCGWLVVREDTSSFTMRFFNGSVMFHHVLIRTGFLPGWMKLVPQERLEEVFALLETNLNKRAVREGVLPLEIPFVCFDCRRE